MQLLDNDNFLNQLAVLFRSSEKQGSIWLTHKRLTYDGEDTFMKCEEGTPGVREYPCLVRATNGKKAMFSTRVAPGDLDGFHAAYGALLKSSMTTLRKRDKKRDKQRSEQALRRKKRMTEPVVIVGPKRGNGRRRRQRLVKASIKQQESQRKFKEREEARAKHEAAEQILQ